MKNPSLSQASGIELGHSIIFQLFVLVYDFLILSNMVSFASFLLSLSLYICSQAGYKFGLLYTFIIISFVLICFLWMTLFFVAEV